MSDGYTKRLLGKEDCNFDTSGLNATTTFEDSSHIEHTLHLLNASHLPLLSGTRWTGVSDVDGAIGDLNARVNAIPLSDVLTANKTVHLSTDNTIRSQIESQPRDLGGYTLTFDFDVQRTVLLTQVISFLRFHNGNVVITGRNCTLSDNNGDLGQLALFKGCYCNFSVNSLNFTHSGSDYGAKVENCVSVDFSGCTFTGGTSNPDSVGIGFHDSLGAVTNVTFATEGTDIGFSGTMGDKFDEIDGTLSEHDDSIESIETDVSDLRDQMDGTVVGNYPILWGRNSSGEMGCGTDSMFGPTLVGMPLHMNFCHFSKSNGAAIFNGMLYVCGLSSGGSLCQFKDSTSGWTCVSEMGDWVKCGVGVNHGAAIRANALYTWGSNSHGQLGNGKTGVNSFQPCHVLSRKESTSSQDPTVITTDDWSSIAVGPQFLLALTSSGVVYGTGNNNSGQLGLGQNAVKTPYFIKCFLGIVKAISAGGYDDGSNGWYGFSFLITTDGKLYSTGRNSNGQLGHGNTTNLNAFTLVSSRLNENGVAEVHYDGLSDWLAVSCGNQHTAAITTDGALYICGSTRGTSESSILTRFKRISMPTGETAKDVVCGYNLTLVLMQSGRVYGFGYNESYSLGEKKSATWDTLKSICRNGDTPMSVAAKAIFSGPQCHGGCFVTDTRLVLDGSVVKYSIVTVSGHATSAVNGNYTIQSDTQSGTERVWMKSPYKIYYDILNNRWSLYNTTTSTEVSHVEVDVSEPVNGSWTNNVTMSIGDE